MSWPQIKNCTVEEGLSENLVLKPEKSEPLCDF